MFGAIGSDLALQLLGVSAFLVPAFLVLYSIRWFRSRPINSPYVKMLGALALLVSCAGLIGLLPWSFRWKGAVPAEGLLGRIVADALIHYLNVVGAYLICLATIAVALYLSTAFSFSGRAGLVADAVFVRLRGPGPLCRLARRTRAQEGRQGTGEEACRCQSQAGRDGADGSAAR